MCIKLYNFYLINSLFISFVFFYFHFNYLYLFFLFFIIFLYLLSKFFVIIEKNFLLILSIFFYIFLFFIYLFNFSLGSFIVFASDDFITLTESEIFNLQGIGAEMKIESSSLSLNEVCFMKNSYGKIKVCLCSLYKSKML